MTTLVAAFGQVDVASVVPGATVLEPSSPLPPDPVVVWLDGLSDSDVAVLATALANRNRMDIAVSSARLDGFNDPPLVHLCRGLIAGFGPAGIAAAIRLINQG